MDCAGCGACLLSVSGAIDVTRSRSPIRSAAERSEKLIRNKRKFSVDPPPSPQIKGSCPGVSDSDSIGMTETTGNGLTGYRSLESTKDIINTLQSANKEHSISKASSSCTADSSDVRLSNWCQHNCVSLGSEEGARIVHSDTQHRLTVDDLASAAITGSLSRDYVSDYNISNGWDNHTETELEELLFKSMDIIYKEAASKIMSLGYTAEKTFMSFLKNGRLYGSKDAISNIVENAVAVMPIIDEDSDENCCGFASLREVQTFSLKELLAVLKTARPSLTNGDAMWCLLVSDMNLAHACAIDQAPIFSLSQKESQISEFCAYSHQLTSTSSTPSHCQKGTNETFLIEPFSPQLQLGLSSLSSMDPLHFHTGKTVDSPRTGSGVVNCESVGHISQPLLPIDSVSETETSTSSILSVVKPGSDISSGNSSALSDDLEEDCVLTMAQPHQKLSLSSLVLENANVSSNSGAAMPSKPLELDPMAAVLKFVVPSDASPKHESQGMLVSACETAGSDIKPSRSLQAFSSGSKLACPRPNLVLPELHSELSSEVEAFHTPPIYSSQKQFQDDATSVSAAEIELSLALSSITCGAVKPEKVSLSSNDEAKATSFKVNEETMICSNFQKRASERQDRALRMLLQRRRDLETQLRERTEWAQEKVVQAARRLSKDLTELKTLRAEREEVIRLRKEKQALDESTVKKLSEMENALRKATGQVDRANAAIRRLEIENAEVRAELEAEKLNAAESVATCEDIMKREKRSVKRAQAWEKQKAKLQEEISTERRKVIQLQQQIAQGKEQHQQAEVRWRQEEKAKEEAILRAEFEKRSREQAGAAAKKREETLRRKADANSQRHRDEIERLERELSQLRFASDPLPLTSDSRPNLAMTPSSMDTYSLQGLKNMNARLVQELADLQDLSQRDVRRDRECVMCMSEEIAVIFLPCAHQIICLQCNDLHEKQGMTDCPSCRTSIERRIRVYGVSS